LKQQLRPFKILTFLSFTSLLPLAFVAIEAIGGIRYVDWGPVNDATKEAVGKVMSKRFNEANFGKAVGGYITASYPKCADKDACLKKYGTIYDLGAKKVEKAECNDTKWFGGHLDCLQGLIDKVNRDIAILNQEIAKLTEGTAAHIRYEKLLQEKIRTGEKMAGYQEGLIKKYIRDAVPGGKDLPFNFVEFSGQGFDRIDLGNGSQDTEAAGGGKTKKSGKGGKISLKKGQPCSAAFPWNCHPDQIGNQATGTGEDGNATGGSLICPVPSSIVGCTPNGQNAVAWSRDSDYLALQEKYCVETLIRQTGDANLQSEYTNAQYDAVRTRLDSLAQSGALSRSHADTIKVGVQFVRGQSTTRGACALLRNSDDPNLANPAAARNALGVIVDEASVPDENLANFVVGMGQIVQQSLARNLGLFASKNKAVGLLGLLFLLEPETSRQDKVNKIILNFSSCGEWKTEEISEFRRFLEDSAQLIEFEFKDSKQKPSDMAEFINFNNAGLIKAIDERYPELLKDVYLDVEQPGNMRTTIITYLEKQLKEGKEQCSRGLVDLGYRAAVSSNTLFNFFQCKDSTMGALPLSKTCEERKKFGWAACGLFEKAQADKKTSLDGELRGIGALLSPLFADRTHHPALSKLGIENGMSETIEDTEEARIHLAMRIMQQLRLEGGVGAKIANRIDLSNETLSTAFIEAGTEVKISLQSSPIYGDYVEIAFTPPLKVESGPLDASFGRIYYKFREGKFSAYLDDETKFAPGTETSFLIRQGLESKLNKEFRPMLPERWQRSGYKPYSDPRPEQFYGEFMRLFNRTNGAGTNSPLGTIGLDQLSDAIADASAWTNLQTKKVHRYMFGDQNKPTGMELANGTRINANLTSTGKAKEAKLKELSVSFSPKMKLGDIDTDGSFKENGYIEIESITFLPDGKIQAKYSIPAEDGLNEFFDGVVGGALLFTGMAGERKAFEKLVTMQPSNTKLDFVRKRIDERLSDQMGATIKDFILNNRDLIPGTDLKTFFGLN